MSNEFFEKIFEIPLSIEQSPITFAHNKTTASPNGHFLHLNDHIELYVFISGDADYIVEDKYVPLKRGDVVVILPHEVHVPVIKSNCIYERFYMLLPLDAFAHFPFDPLSLFSMVKNHKISLPHEKRERFLSLLYQISNFSSLTKEYSSRLETIGLFFQALSLISSEISMDSSSLDEVDSFSKLPLSLREILKYIGKYAQDIPSASAIAKHFFLSPQYLSTLFKKYVGVNLNNYLRIKKIALAKILLEKGYSVADACYECGFSDSSHFIKNFKSIVGVTPKQYKNSFIKK